MTESVNLVVKMLVATVKAGFTSFELLTPDKPRGTFVPLIETLLGTRCLAAKQITH